MKKLLFTDLDGTLLDLQSYSCEQVKDAVARLRNAGVSIIFCSSKTWAEQAFYLDQLQLEEPVIVENGSGIFIPEKSPLTLPTQKKTWHIHGHDVLVLGQKYDQVLEAIEKSASKHYPEAQYYHNLTLEEITNITGLSIAGAENAKSRDFTETIFNADRNSAGYQHFEKEMNTLGFQCIPGSKFVTITSRQTDKGKAVELLTGLFKQQFHKVVSYGAGDSLNDLEMLEAVDYPYLVQRPDHTWVACTINNINKVHGVGPEGWNILADEILKR